MAGSYKHIVDNDNNFIGSEHLDDMGDAFEALEECWHFINILSGGDKAKIAATHLEYLRRIGGNVALAEKMGYWK